MQDYSYIKHKPQNKLFFKWCILLFFILLLLGFIKRNFGNANQEITSPLPQVGGLEKSIISFFSQKPKDSRILLANIKKLTDAVGGSWSIYVYDLSNDQGFGINETTIYNAASVNKIPLLASLYYLAGKGEINLDQQVTLQAEDIQDYGTGSIRYDPPGTTYSIKTLARLMIEKSDNTAAYIIGRQIIGMDKIQKLVEDWGLTQTDMENDKTSLVDMAKLLTKMYQKEITSEPLTLEMLGFMDKSDFEDRIPGQIPKEIKIYHKTGDGPGNIHDIGIVMLDKHPFIIGFFTADITDNKTATSTIARISKMVFEFMKS